MIAPPEVPLFAAVDALPEFALSAGSPVGADFLRRGVADFRAAAAYVHALPYGRNSDRADPACVLREGCGTCSTKHALLARLASEHGQSMDLAVGVYEMTEANTPGVGAVLHRHALHGIPEAHCYLVSRGVRVDVTRAGADAAEPIARFIHEETISPEQIGEHKLRIHRETMQRWLDSGDAGRPMDLATAWRIREDCIAALSEEG
ncbi:MAG TPA: hypothetical protein VFE05_21290 [Longimicrobiaceae bacterium]|nr:hypothetical protein [Longimicrobiaceae bacterium]